jgi:DNA-binding IclR family transcriptional regulator
MTSSDDPVPRIVRALIDGGVSRLEQVEVLVALSRAPESAWDAAAVARRTAVAAPQALAALATLERQGLARRAAAQRDDFSLGERADRAQLDVLRAAYDRDRSRVAHAFFAANLDHLRSALRKPGA